MDTRLGAWLVERQFKVRLSLASVGTLLARLGLSAQKPLQRAYQCDRAAVARWQQEIYPALARTARQQKADIYFGDESGFRADYRSWQNLGNQEATPAGPVPGQRQTISGLGS